VSALLSLQSGRPLRRFLVQWAAPEIRSSEYVVDTDTGVWNKASVVFYEGL